MSKPEQIEEERRLAYVGFTRAMQRLYLVRARRRSLFGETQYTEPRASSKISRLISSRIQAVHQSKKKIKTHRRQNNWDDDFNQDPYGDRGGRIIGRGTPPVHTPNIKMVNAANACTPCSILQNAQFIRGSLCASCVKKHWWHPGPKASTFQGR